MFFSSNIANYALYAAVLLGVAIAVYFLVTKLLGDSYDEGFFGFFDKDNEEEDYDEYEYDEDDEDEDFEDDDEEDFDEDE